jgi:hypothetical protein
VPNARSERTKPGLTIWIDRRRSPMVSNVVMHKQFALLLALFLGSYMPSAAQEAAPYTVPLHTGIAPTMSRTRTVQAPLRAAAVPQLAKSAAATTHFH